MRNFLLILVLLIVALAILWLTAGRQISEFVDRLKIQTVSDYGVGGYLRYEGTGDGGVLSINNLSLSLAPRNPHVGTTKDNQLAIANNGRVFALGPVSRAADDTIETDSSENTAMVHHARSYIPWPSFEDGLIPRLNRNEFYDYVATDRNGQRLKMLWSVDSANNTTSLIRIEISDASR